MPHVNMKHFPSLTNEQRDELSNMFINAISYVVKCPKDFISVAFEPIEPEKWMSDIYPNEILGKKQFTHTFPNYNPNDEIL
ncbi:tautomerase family protein [Brenneria izbisi]|uniref:Tautomerase family protein n=1 Tax=Brenneria izbisi TaxID=2939450 RepID=A0AA41XZZ8_9GAMM|nr:tautomerase family protein [Brenneria izbisi]MCV9878112.1 tautomerase family protein [Brenneria izbisi]MCV9881324.1 tautomerase family protein [Brenneria izbisi]